MLTTPPFRMARWLEIEYEIPFRRRSELRMVLAEDEWMHVLLTIRQAQQVTLKVLFIITVADF